MISAPRLEAPGVVLRQLDKSDASVLHAAHSDPTTHHYWSSPAHQNVEQTVRYIEETLALRGARAWAITETGEEALGRIALFEIRTGVGEIGIILSREAQGRGMASNAVKLVGEYGFERLGLHRLVADIDPDNSASLTLFLRNGFHREGVLKQNWKTHLGLRDSVIMAKLKDS